LTWTAVVTGGAGFLGSHLAKELLRDTFPYPECRVIVLDDLSGGFKRNIPAGAQFELCDLRDAKRVDDIIRLSRPQIVYHLAADATEGRSQFTPKSAVGRNMVATTNLLTSSVNWGVKRFVFTSSMAVYGSQPTPLSEEMERRPEDVYGTCKAACERIIEIFGEVHGLDWTIIRPHNVYGPGQRMNDPFRNVIAIFINRALKALPPYIYGDGQQKRAFSYIDDITRPLLEAGMHDAASKQIINLGSGEVHTINELASLVYGERLGQNMGRYAVYVPIRPQEVLEAFCTIEKSENILGYKTKTSLQEGIQKMTAWARELGPTEMDYTVPLEIEKGAPVTWKERLI